MFNPAIIRYQIRDAFIYWICIPAAVIVSGTGADIYFNFPVIARSVLLLSIAGIMLLAGSVLIWLSMRNITQAGGTPNPLRPPKTLITSGGYALCRHPMFLGYDLCAVSVILFLGSPGMLYLSFPVFLLLQIRFMRREEKILLLKFKQSYADYQAQVSFLVPFALCKKAGDKAS